MENINIANNFVYSIITTLVTGIVNVVYPLIIGIIFDSSIMGRFSILFSWVALLAIPISNGIAPAITRFTAAENKNKSKQVLKTGIQTTLIYGILVLTIFPVIGLLVLDMKIIDLILIIGLILSTIFHYVFRRYLQGLEQFKKLMKIEIASFFAAFVPTVISVILVMFNKTESEFLINWLLSPIMFFHIIFLIFIFFTCFKGIRMPKLLKWNKNYVKPIVRYSFLVGVGSLFGLGTSRLQIIVSDFHLSKSDVGLLSFWYFAVTPISLLSIALGSMLVARITNLLKQKKELAKKFVYSLNWILVLIILPLASIFMIIVSIYPQILDVITFSNYQMVYYWPIFVLFLSQVINSLLATPTLALFSSSEKMVRFLPIASFCYSISVIISWFIFVPKYSIYGFAISTAIGGFVFYTTIHLFEFAVISRKFGFHSLVNVAVSVLTLLVLILINEYDFDLTILTVSIIVYIPVIALGVIKLIKTIKTEEYSKRSD